MAIHPDRSALYAVTSDAEDVQGANIFRAKTFTHGLPVTR